MNQDTLRHEPHSSQTRGRGCRRVLTIGGALVLLACGGCFYRIYTFMSPGPADIGPDTTVIEGPLLPDGRVDYLTALNERMGEGVTPENNAAVPLVQAFGLDMIAPEFRWEYLDRLGIPDMPLDGEHVVGQIEWIRRDDGPGAPFDGEREQAIQDEFHAAMSRAWTSEEFPEVAGWLEANETPLELIVAASARPRFYSPLVAGGEPPLINALLPLQQEARSAARLLTARAMLRLGEGDVDGAWADLLASQRLARLIGQGETLINDLVAVAISAVACAAGESLAHDERLTAEQARQFAADLESLDPIPRFAETLNVGERFTALDAFQSMAKGNAGVAPGLQPLAGRGFDWSQVMRLTNERYDRIATAFELDSHRDRLAALKELDAEWQASAAGGMTVTKLIAAGLIGSRRQVSEQLTNVLFKLLAPAFVQAGVAEARAETRMRLIRVALMLAAFRADHGAYPPALEQLSPGDLTRIPLDPFSDQPFHYETTATGYRLYSVGDNMTDDGGLTYDSDPPGDDIIVETPIAADGATDQPGESL